ncbi:hypothetical protein KPH14_012963, partial [Odynerus spinipes]
VDDMIIAHQNDKDIADFEKKLQRKIQISCLGDVTTYLGIEVKRDKNGIFNIGLTTYIDKILKRFGLSDVKESRIPLDPGYVKETDSTTLLPDNNKYREAIGALLYISVNTRPDIAAAVSIL